MVSLNTSSYEGVPVPNPPDWIRGPEWLDAYAQQVQELKQLEGDEVQMCRAAVREAFGTIYRTVALDIDGTLTEDDSPVLHEDVGDRVADMLLRGIPIVLVTGRGRTGGREVADLLIERTGLARWYRRRLYLVVRNGVTLLRSIDPDSRVWMEHEERLCEPFESAPDLAQVLAERKLEGLVRLDPKADSVRLAFSSAEERNEAIGLVREESLRIRGDLRLTVSGYGELSTIDVCPTDKGEALASLSRLLGIPPNTILRIGDQGAPGGNDHAMLDDRAGFSVGTISATPDRCHPVFDVALTQQFGAEATGRLLDQVIVNPPLSLDPNAKVIERVGPELRQVVRRAAPTSQSVKAGIGEDLRRHVSRLLNRPGITIDQSTIFDPRSGAVRLRDYELDELDLSSVAARLFDLDRFLQFGQEPESRWAMFSDSGILLRGPGYWPAWTQPRQEISEFLQDSIELCEAAADAVSDLGQAPTTLPALKLTLALADNVRNRLLHALHALFLEETEGRVHSGSLAEFVSDSVLPFLNYHVRELLFGDSRRPWGDLHYALSERMMETAAGLVGLAELLPKEARARDIKKIARIRECDDLLENIAGVQLGLANHFTHGRWTDGEQADLIAIGLVYGGIELPLLARCLAQRDRRGVVHPGFFKISMYSDMAAGDRARARRPGRVADLAGQFKAPIVVGFDDASDEMLPTLVLDDNSTTAKTFQWAIDLLAFRGFPIAGGIVVRHPSINRLVQMAMEDHGLPDPEAMMTVIRGLVGTSPYARLVTVGPDAARYQDQTGVFDKAKMRILRHLFKNGSIPPERLEGFRALDREPSDE